MTTEPQPSSRARTEHLERISASIERIGVIQYQSYFASAVLTDQNIVDIADMLEIEEVDNKTAYVLKTRVSHVQQPYLSSFLTSFHTHYVFLRDCNGLSFTPSAGNIGEAVAGLLTFKSWFPEVDSMSCDQDRQFMLLSLAACRGGMDIELYQQSFEYGAAMFLCHHEVTDFVLRSDMDTVMAACNIITERPMENIVEVEALLKQGIAAPLRSGTL